MCFADHPETGAPASHGFSSKREVLPNNVTPSHYCVSLFPKLNDDYIFSGSITVDLIVNQDTTSIVTNAKKLVVISGKVINGDKTIEASSITLDTALERVTYEFPEVIPAGSKVSFETSFTGAHNDQMAGFYRSSYKATDGSKQYMGVTQFESTDARQCFPCWDEPNLKATFDVILNVDPSHVALSNMNAISEKYTLKDGKTYKAVAFATTPIVSTYLIAFCVGEFEYIETTSYPKDANPIKVRVYTPPGEVSKGHFALEVAARTLEFFSEYFNTPYPLPKMDMVAVPDFAAGAMENWGLVTYRTAILLFDENTSASAKQSIAYVVGHELAHQWFGNLVTMDWWSDLWLNEGFATFVGWMAVDNLFPEWDVWTQFVDNSCLPAFAMDSLRTSHPIEVEVQKAHEIMQIFDAISYLKGGSIIRMLCAYLGKDTFMNGVRSYLQEFKFKNASTVDLWRHLGAAHGKDIQNLMYVWTNKIGYPVVTVVNESYDTSCQQLTITLRQNRFLASGDVKPEEDQVLWPIPLLITSNGSKTPSDHLMTEREMTVTIPYTQGEDSWWKLNHDGIVFNRVNYQDSQIAGINKALMKNIDIFTPSERMSIVSDVFALARAGYSSTARALDTLGAFRNEHNYSVLTCLNDRMIVTRDAFSFQADDVVEGIISIRREVFGPKAKELGLDYLPTDGHLDALKRTLVIRAACSSKDQATVAEIKSRYQRHISGEHKALHPNLFRIGYATSLATAENPEAVLEELLKISKTAESIDQRLAALGSIGSVPKIELVDKVFDMLFDKDIVRAQDTTSVVGSIAAGPNPKQVVPHLWNLVISRFPELYASLGDAMSIIGNTLSIAASGQSGMEFVENARNWADGVGLCDEDKAVHLERMKGCRVKLDQTLEGVVGKTKWVERDAEAVSTWVRNYNSSK